MAVINVVAMPSGEEGCYERERRKERRIICQRYKQLLMQNRHRISYSINRSESFRMNDFTLRKICSASSSVYFPRACAV